MKYFALLTGCVLLCSGVGPARAWYCEQDCKRQSWYKEPACWSWQKIYCDLHAGTGIIDNSKEPEIESVGPSQTTHINCPAAPEGYHYEGQVLQGSRSEVTCGYLVKDGPESPRHPKGAGLRTRHHRTRHRRTYARHRTGRPRRYWTGQVKKSRCIRHATSALGRMQSSDVAEIDKVFVNGYKCGQASAEW